MKTKRFLPALITVVTVILILSATALTAFAFNTPNDIKSVALTLDEPKAGATIDLSYGSVTCDTPMDYKVVGVHWYKGNETDYLNDRLGEGDNDKYFIGNYFYTVKIELAVKGNKTWNFEYVHGEPVYHINATVNGQAATVSARELNPDEKIICVTYKFENIPEGEITPYVRVATPVAGQTKNDVIVAPYNEREIYRASWSEDCNWYHRVGDAWVAMDTDDIFMTGKDYRLVATFYPHDGFRFSASGTHTVGEDGYIYGYVNGKQMSMKLEKYADQFLYHRVTFTYDFESCKAQELGSVSFEGIQAPVAGQNPLYAVTMGDSTYSLVTDDAVSGGAEYGFVNGIAWKLGYGEPLTAQSTFEQGAYYTLSFFIRSDDIHRFTDMVVGSANVGYVSVQTMDDPTLAFVTVDFALCGGGEMRTLGVGGFREPVHGASPDSNLFCGQGYEKYGELKWIEVTEDGECDMEPGDAFVYGNQYKVVMVLKTTDGFTFADRNALTVNVNGQKADQLTGYESMPESEYVTVAKYFDCAKAPIPEVSVTVENPLEGKTPAQQIKLNGDTYAIESFMISDCETDTILLADDVYVGLKNYCVTVIIAANEGYSIADGITAAFINGQEASVISYGIDRVIFMSVLVAEELPYYGVSFSDGQSFLTKAGKITLPEYEGILGENEKFVGWTVDYQTTLAGEYYITENTEFLAVIVAEDVHQHIYDNTYIDNGQGMHYRQCIDEECPDIVGSVIDQGNHQYENMDPCEMICTVCGHERVSDVGFGYHNYEFACSEVCPTCGKTRETSHTPGTAANCTEAQTCTVCAKVLADALGHTAGEAATCTAPQKCTVCDVTLVEAKGHTEGEAATCTAPQKCTVCDVTLVEAKGHTPGDAATCTSPQKCLVCDAELAPAGNHSAGVEWISDEAGHHKLCACGEKVDAGEHKDADSDKVCDACGYKMSKGLSAGAIVAIVIGAAALLGGGGFCLYWFVIRKKKQ